MGEESELSISGGRKLRFVGAVEAGSPPVNRGDPLEWLQMMSNQEHVDAGAELLKQQRAHEALIHFLCVLGDDPDHPLAHYLSGLAYQSLGLEDEARDEWNTVDFLTTQASRRDNEDPDSGWAREKAWELLKHTSRDR